MTESYTESYSDFPTSKYGAGWEHYQQLCSLIIGATHWKTYIGQPPVHIPGAHSRGTVGRQAWIHCSGWLVSGLHGGWIDDRMTTTLSPQAAWNHQSFGSTDLTEVAPGTPPTSNTALMQTWTNKIDGRHSSCMFRCLSYLCCDIPAVFQTNHDGGTVVQEFHNKNGHL